MSIDKATVSRIATLARLRVPEAELEPLARELQGIMTWIEQLEELDTAAIEPMAHAVHVSLPMRDDVVTDGNCVDRILSNAPDPVRTEEGGFFTVPKVVE